MDVPIVYYRYYDVPRTNDLYHALRVGKLRIDDTACCSSDGDIIAQHDKLDVQHAAPPYAPNVDPSPILVVPVEPWLRSVDLLVHNDHLLGC